MYPGNVMCEYSVYIYICIHTLHRKPHPRPLSQRCQGIKKDHTCKYKMKNRICEYNVWSSLICRYKILIAICSNKMLIYNILISIYTFMYIYMQRDGTFAVAWRRGIQWMKSTCFAAGSPVFCCFHSQVVHPALRVGFETVARCHFQNPACQVLTKFT